MVQKTRYGAGTRCRLEPFIDAVTQCPIEQRACMLWAFALRLRHVAYYERPATFACLLQAIRQLPSNHRAEALAELGLHITELPPWNQSTAFQDLVAAVSEISEEFQMEPLVDLSFAMVAQAYPPDTADHDILH